MGLIKGKDPFHSNLNEFNRVALFGDISGHLVNLDKNAPLSCIAVDISKNNLRIMSFERLKEDQKLCLAVGGINYPLRVVSCRSDASKPDIFECILNTLHRNFDLFKIFSDAGLLDQFNTTEEWLDSFEMVRAGNE